MHIYSGLSGSRKLTTICGKFAAVCCGIGQTGRQEMEKSAVEYCGP